MTTRNPTERLGARKDRRILVFWTSSPARASSFICYRVWYAYFKELCKRCCTAVMQTNNMPRIAPSFSRVLCVRTLGYPRAACCRSGCCLFSKVGCLRELVHPRLVFDNRSSARVTQKSELNCSTAVELTVFIT